MNKEQIKNAVLLGNELLAKNGTHFEAFFDAVLHGEVVAVYKEANSTSIDFFIEASNLDLEDWNA